MEFKDINFKQLIANRQSDLLNQYETEWDKKIDDTTASLAILDEVLSGIEVELIKMRNDMVTKKIEHEKQENVVKQARYLIKRYESQKSQINSAFWRAK